MVCLDGRDREKSGKGKEGRIETIETIEEELVEYRSKGERYFVR